MDAELKRKWVEALRSGAYTQLQNGFHHSNKHCCLGVLGSILTEDRDRPAYPDEELSGTTTKERIVLINMNDGGKSFAQIADYIEQNL